MTTILDVPTDPFIVHILADISIAGVARLALTCKQFATLCRSEKLWTHLYRRDLSERPLPSTSSYREAYCTFITNFNTKHRSIGGYNHDTKDTLIMVAIMYGCEKLLFNYDRLLKPTGLAASVRGGCVLFFAIDNKRLDIVKLFNIHSDEVKNNILHRAASIGCLEIVQYAIDLGADELDYALYSAVRHGYLDVSEILIRHGCDINKVFSQALECKQLHMIDRLIELGANDYNCLLWNAVEWNRIDWFNRAIEMGADPSALRDKLRVKGIPITDLMKDRHVMYKRILGIN